MIEFKVMIIIIKQFGRRLDEQREKLVFNKELEKMKKNQTEMKNTITEFQREETQAVNDERSGEMQKQRKTG